MSATIAILVGAIFVSILLSLGLMGIFYVIRGKRLAARSRTRTANAYDGCQKGREFVIADDISNGREFNKVPAISYAPNDATPLDFHYVGEHVCVDPVQVDTSLGRLNCCQCLGDCATSDCECLKHNRAGPFYDLEGRLCESYLSDAMGAIRECNIGCKCNRKLCKNMVVQGGSQLNVILFKTKSRGWGVRTTEAIPKGTFIGNYSGELISAQSSTKRVDDTYLFNLSNSILRTQTQLAEEKPLEANEKPLDLCNQTEVAVSYEGEREDMTDGYGDGVEEETSEIVEMCDEPNDFQPLEQQVPNEATDLGEQVTSAPAGGEQVTSWKPAEEQYFICDAKHYGNFTRFINHSCEPNVIGLRTFTVHQDSRFPYISFFANQDIPAGEELTLNYGDNYWLVKCRRDHVYCLCKTPTCRFTKKTFKHTLKRYNEQMQAAGN